MASGDVISRKERFVHIKMLDALAAADNGVWIECHGYDQVSIHIDGITTATVTVNASSKATKPANTVHDIVRASLTADGEVTYQVLPRWMKCRISAWTSGTVSAFAVFRLTGGRR